MKEINFLEACEALRDGKCKEIKSENGVCYYIKDGIIRYSLAEEGIFLSPELFLGKWYLIGVNKKVVIENVVWNIGTMNSIIPSAIFEWGSLVNKPKMKMTLEWEE